MTIFSPNQSKFRINLKFVWWAFILVCLALLSIQLQNSNVTLRHSVSILESKVQELQVASADYKNELYKVLDSKNLQMVAQKLSLIKDAQPLYLEGNITIASQ